MMSDASGPMPLRGSIAIPPSTPIWMVTLEVDPEMTMSEAVLEPCVKETAATSEIALHAGSDNPENCAEMFWKPRFATVRG